MKISTTLARKRSYGWAHLLLDLTVMTSIIIFVTSLLWGPGHLLTAGTVRLGVPVSFGVVGTLLWEGIYTRVRSRRWPAVTALVGRSVVSGAAGFALAAFFFGSGSGARRWVVIVSVLWFIWLWAHHGLRAVLRRNRSRVIVAGSPRQAVEMRDVLEADRRHAYDVVGFVVDQSELASSDAVISASSLGFIDDLPALAEIHRANQVMFCMDGLVGGKFAPLARMLNRQGVDVSLTGLGDVARQRVGVRHVEGHPVISIAPPVRTGWRMGLKRTLDVAISATALLVLSPLLVAVAAAIRIVDGAPPIFRQTRVGKGGALFTILKFQTMVVGAEELQIDLTNELDGAVFKMESDPRVTRIGALLRKTSIDELPQLWNVLRGDMSLVGPRPFIESEVTAAPESFRYREVVAPGMTGRWQVSGRSDTDFGELDELDRWYVENWSLGQDLEILVKTVPAVLLARGAR